MHGLIFFYIRKFADLLVIGATSPAGTHSPVAASAANYLPSGVYPDEDATALLKEIAATTGTPLPELIGRFGEFLAPHLVKIAAATIDPSWRTLDLIEHTESLIHTMVRADKPGASPPVLEALRAAPDEVHLVYSSRRRLCVLAAGLIRGMARHYGETVTITETSCMLRGDPFCSFVIRKAGRDTDVPATRLVDTVVLPAGARADDDVHVVAGGSLADDPLPERIGRHTVLALIGSGSMGRVYLAIDDRLGRRVAIKVLHPARARDPDARLRFVRESRLAASVEHPNVLTIHEVGEEGGVPYTVMQLLEGEPLSGLRDRGADVAETLRIGREIASGLAAAHARGLVHRDIKPENIFLEGPSRSVRIIDFGLARAAGDDDTRVTVENAIVGTPAYMAPERIGGGPPDAAGDLFGLGVILYELLARRLPFEGSSLVTILAAISRGQPTHLAEAAPDIPAGVCDLVMRLIAHDKADRPRDARAVVDAITVLERTLAAS